MNVLLIPEDFRKDQYILKPIIEAMLAAVGKPRANVRVCQDPLLGGNPKEVYFEPLARHRGVTDGPGQGRKTLAREAAASYRRIRSRCPEDIIALETRLSTLPNQRHRPEQMQ